MGKVDPVVRPPTAKGAYRIAAALAERHSIDNLGDAPSDFLRVELKQINLQLPEPYRGKAPSNLAQSEDAIEFTNPVLQIERIICTGAISCPVKPSSSPSLLVAFTPLQLAMGNSSQKLDDGSVQWLPASQPATIVSSSASPAHVLRILFTRN